MSSSIYTLGHWEICLIIDTLLQSNNYKTVIKLMRTSKFMYSIVHPKWVYYLDHLPSITDNTGTWTGIGCNKQLLHSCNDKPAIIYKDSTRKWKDDTQEWYQYGQLHRDNDLPATSGPTGRQWFQYGQLHRDNDKPAVIYSDGVQEWYQHGQLHRDNNLPNIIFI